MPLSSMIWSDGLGDPKSGPGREFETLRTRRVHVRAEVRAAGIADQEADRRLVAAQRETRLKRAEKNAMGGKLALAAGAASLVAAEEAAAKATARVRDAQDSLAWIDHAAEELVQQHAGELLAEVGAAAERAQEATIESLRRARAALAEWAMVARRQEAILSASGGAYQHERAPVEQLRVATTALAKTEASLPAAAVGTRAAA